MFENVDAATLARIQFALNVTVHFIFPSITIALGWVLLGLKFDFYTRLPPRDLTHGCRFIICLPKFLPCPLPLAW